MKFAILRRWKCRSDPIGTANGNFALTPLEPLLEYLLPKWHGDVREVEKFAQEAVKRTSTTEGTALYARIYWAASQTQFDNALFSKSFAFWPAMKGGFEDIVAKYPDAWNLNNYAKFSCLAKDKAKTAELVRRIQSNIVPEAWEPLSLLKHCIDWALTLQKA